MTIITEVSDVDDMEIEIPSKSLCTSADDIEIQIPTHKSLGLGLAIDPDLSAMTQFGCLQDSSLCDDMEIEIPSKTRTVGRLFCKDARYITGPRTIIISRYLAPWVMKIAESFPDGLRMEIFSALLTMFFLPFICKDPGYAPVHNTPAIAMHITDHLAPEDLSMMETKNYLTDDLVIEILIRLPSQSLCKFKCVSKAWDRFISSFGLLHPMSGLFIDHRLSKPDKEFYLPFAPTSPQLYQPEWKDYLCYACSLHRLRAIHSSNALMLLCALTHGGYMTTEYYVYIIPSSIFVHIDASKPDYCGFGEKYDLPHTHSHRIEEFDPALVHCFLAFDPHEDPSQYQVVRLTTKDNSIRVQIFSSFWRRWFEYTIPQEYPFHLDNWLHMSTYHKGAHHIITYDDHIVRFDTNNASFQLIELPLEGHLFCSRDKCCQRRRQYTRCGIEIEPLLASYIGESRGHLYYAVNTCPLNELHIYMLEEGDTKKWQLVHKTSTQQLSKQCDFMSYQPIAFHPQSEIVYLGTNSGILLYDPNTGSLVEVPIKVEEVYWTDVCPVFYYI